MIEKRSSSIHEKVIKPVDIINLAKLFDEIHKELMDKYNNDVKNKIISDYSSKPNISFHLQSDDGVEYSSDNLELFQKDGVIYNRAFIHLGFRVSYYELNFEARISLSERLCDFEVEGSDVNWVRSTFQRLQECASLWEHQESAFKRWRWPISIILILMADWVLIYVVVKISSLFSESVSFPAVITLVVLIVSVICVFNLAEYFYKLWPDVEIVPEPEHKRVLQKKRSQIKWIFSVIIIPFIITLIVALALR